MEGVDWVVFDRARLALLKACKIKPIAS